MLHHFLVAALLTVFISTTTAQDSAPQEDREAGIRREIAELTERIKTNPRDFGAFYNRGLAHEQIQDYDEAIADYVSALNPKSDFSRLIGPKE